jgi:hypothetical protein
VQFSVNLALAINRGDCVIFAGLFGSWSINNHMQCVMALDQHCDPFSDHARKRSQTGCVICIDAARGNSARHYCLKGAIDASRRFFNP